MIGRLFTLVSVLSLLLCVATAALWARSQWRGDEVGWVSRGRSPSRGEQLALEVFSECGQIDLNYQWYEERLILSTTVHDWPAVGMTNRTPYRKTMAPFRGRYAHLTRFGFRYGQIVRPDLVSRGLVVPHWFVLVVTAVFPSWWITLWRRRRFQRRPGRCLACGYDLCATPQRCPECGAVPPEFSE
jgi:hypothetical protein